MGSGHFRASLAWLVASSLLVACNALSGLDEDYSLDEGAVLPGEGGADGSSGSSGSSGGIDGSMPDSVGPDGEVPGDGGTWCPANATWCENWDDERTTWDRDDTQGGTLGVEPNQGVGGSQALHARANSVTMSRAVARWKSLAAGTPTNGRYWLKFAFRIKQNDIDYAVIGAVSANNTTTSNTEYGVAAYTGCPGACLDENNPAQEGNHDFSGQTPYTLDAWHRAEISVVRTGAGAYAGTVTVDNGPPLDMGGSTFFGDQTEPSLLEVGVGVFFTANDVGTADVYIDEIAAGKD